jgi:uncharacterized protein
MTKIGIISDTHNNIDSIKKAIDIFKQNNVDYIIHCGDISNPESVEHFKDIKTKFVKGNMDIDIDLIEQKIKKTGNEYLGKYSIFKEDEKTIAVFHGDDKNILKDIIEKNPDFLFLGHSHKPLDTKINNTRIFNPGGHTETGPKPYQIIILDLSNENTKKNAEFIPLN